MDTAACTPALHRHSSRAFPLQSLQVCISQHPADAAPVLLQKAASIDPPDRASLPGPEGDTARQARLDGAYAIAMNVVRFLVDPGRANQALQNVALSPGERQAYLKQFLQVGNRTSTLYWHPICPLQKACLFIVDACCLPCDPGMSSFFAERCVEMSKPGLDCSSANIQLYPANHESPLICHRFMNWRTRCMPLHSCAAGSAGARPVLARGPVRDAHRPGRRAGAAGPGRQRAGPRGVPAVARRADRLGAGGARRTPLQQTGVLALASVGCG